MSIKNVYDQFKHLDELLSNAEECVDDFSFKLAHNLWLAVKEEAGRPGLPREDREWAEVALSGYVRDRDRNRDDVWKGVQLKRITRILAALDGAKP